MNDSLCFLLKVIILAKTLGDYGFRNSYYFFTLSPFWCLNWRRLEFAENRWSGVSHEVTMRKYYIDQLFTMVVRTWYLSLFSLRKPLSSPVLEHIKVLIGKPHPNSILVFWESTSWKIIRANLTWAFAARVWALEEARVIGLRVFSFGGWNFSFSNCKSMSL